MTYGRSENGKIGEKMIREFIMTPTFDRRWENLNLNDDDLQELQNYIMKNPNAGDVIPDTGGAIKLRWLLGNRGKRGGVRIIYADIVRKARTHLLICYSKNEQDNISNEQKKQLREVMKKLKGE